MGSHVWIPGIAFTYISVPSWNQILGFENAEGGPNLQLVTYNKKCLYGAVRASGSTHDARMLRNSAINQKIVTVHAIPDRVIDLGEHGKIPLVTVAETAFSEHEYASNKREK